MLLKGSDLRRVIDLQWHARNNQIEQLMDWLIDENTDFSRTKFSKIMQVAEKMQELVEKSEKK